jgi:hypothetical protein
MNKKFKEILEDYQNNNPKNMKKLQKDFENMLSKMKTIENKKVKNINIETNEENEKQTFSENERKSYCKKNYDYIKDLRKAYRNKLLLKKN